MTTTDSVKLILIMLNELREFAGIFPSNGTRGCEKIKATTAQCTPIFSGLAHERLKRFVASPTQSHLDHSARDVGRFKPRLAEHHQDTKIVS